MNKEKCECKRLEKRLEKLQEKYKDALDVIKQLERMPIESYYINKFKAKYREEF